LVKKYFGGGKTWSSRGDGKKQAAEEGESMVESLRRRRRRV
jgi:hypothetical protein